MSGWRFLAIADDLQAHRRKMRCEFGVLDTEDDSKELMRARRSGFDKTVTQIAAVCSDGRRFHNRGNVDEFLNWLRRQVERGVRKWYAHNLQYDLGNLFGDELDELEVTMVGGRLIRANWEGVIFLDSFNLFPVKAEKLGKAVGLEKLEFDAHSREYVFRDCEIVREALHRLIGTCRQHGVDYPANTLGGLCVQLWQAMGGVNHSDHSLNSRDAIFGGRVELFSRGGRGNILYTDINSLYPWAMTQPFPAELLQVNHRRARLCRWGITTATVQIPEQWLAPLPYRVTLRDELDGVHESSIVFPCGRFTGTWTNHELRNAVEHHGAKILRVHQQFGADKAGHPYRDFVHTFYRLRMSQQDEAYRLIYKLLMNNLYGQLGMGGGVTRSARLDNEKADEIRKGLRTATVFGNAILYDVRIPLPDHVNYAHAAHVTSYGRLRLLEYLRQVEPANLIYCDTDSAFFFHPEDRPPPFQLGSELGQMKLEGVGRRADVLAPKTYRMVKQDRIGWRTNHKAKGVPQRAARHFIEHGWAEYEAPFKMREAINFFDRGPVTWKETRSGKVPVYGEMPRANSRRLSVWRVVSKELRSRYAKKKPRADGSFTPLVLKE